MKTTKKDFKVNCDTEFGPCWMMINAKSKEDAAKECLKLDGVIYIIELI